MPAWSSTSNRSRSPGPNAEPGSGTLADDHSALPRLSSSITFQVAPSRDQCTRMKSVAGLVDGNA